MSKRVCYHCLHVAEPVPNTKKVKGLSKEQSESFMMCEKCKKRTFFSR